MPLLTPRLLLVSKSRLLIGLLATAAVLLAFGLFPSDARAADSPTETLELHPGDNFVGWVAEPIAVADIFEQISAATLIYTWNADSRTYRYAIRDIGGTLERLDPGMSARIRIEGRKTVKWERSLTPAKGMVTLYSGVNWVAWNGRDEWPLDQVARGIGTSLVSIEVEERGIVYQPNDNIAEAIEPLSGKSTLRRGDALRVTVNRDLRWLQPTGMMPNIEWVGDFPQALQDKITTDFERITDFFAEEFGVETDFSETNVLIWSTVDAAVEYQASGALPRFPGTPSGLRVTLENYALAGAGPGLFWVPACGWMPPCPFAHGREGGGILTSTHESFHALQDQLTVRSALDLPIWLIEGAAVWAEWQLPSDLQIGSVQSERDWRLSATARTTVTLQSAEGRNTPWEYRLGVLAAERLVELSGVDAQLEFLRRLYPQITGSERRWERSVAWEEAFREAFGLTPAAFYEEFEAWRETLPTPRQQYDYDQDDLTLSGTLHYSDSAPASGFRVSAAPYQGEEKAGLERATIVDGEGNFAIDLAPETTQRIWFTQGGCALWLTNDGLTVARPQQGWYRDLDTRDLPELNLTLPEDACENELRVKVATLRGDQRRLEALLIDETNMWSRLDKATADEYVTFAPEPGKYGLGLRLGNCSLWYSEGGLVASNQDADVLELSDQPLSIELRIPHDLCVHRISGTLLYEDGTAVSDVWLHVGRGDASSALLTSADGEFIVAVPDSGDYTLSFGTDVPGCRIGYSESGATTDSHRETPITVTDSDVTGIEFVVPNDPASLCE